MLSTLLCLTLSLTGKKYSKPNHTFTLYVRFLYESLRTGVEKGMKLCTAVQEGCGYKTHWTLIATMLYWQNISLCTLFISRPSYKSILTYCCLKMYMAIQPVLRFYMREVTNYFTIKKAQIPLM